MAAFNEGATAEEIAQQYPSLNLADIYAELATICIGMKKLKAILQNAVNLLKLKEKKTKHGLTLWVCESVLWQDKLKNSEISS